MCGATVGNAVTKTVGTITGNRGGEIAPVVGQPETAKTPIGDSGAAAVGQRRRPRSLLSGTALGDISAANVAPVAAKPTLGG